MARLSTLAEILSVYAATADPDTLVYDGDPFAGRRMALTPLRRDRSRSLAQRHRDLARAHARRYKSTLRNAA